MGESRTWIGRQSVNFWLAVAAVGLVVAWRVMVVAWQPAHWKDAATEIGSIAQSKEELVNLELLPNHAGTGLVYFQETETGLGTYFHDFTGGKNKLLFEHAEKNYSGQFGMLAWSPDDKLFACAVLTEANTPRPKREIILYHGVTGAPLAKMAADGLIPESKFIWLSPRSFAYSTYNQAWLVFEQKTGSQWVQTRVIKRFTDTAMKNLTVMSPRSLAWQQGGELWNYDLAAGTTTKIWASTTNELTGFSFSTATGEFLLRCRDGGGSLFIRLGSPRMKDAPREIVGMTRDDARSSYADLSLEQGVYTFQIKTEANADPSRFAWAGMLEYHKLAGDNLYFTGNLPDGPPGIWQYDVKAKESRCLASGLSGKLKHTKMVMPTVGLGTNAAGKPFSYHLWQPTGFSAGKKYPLILGQAHYMWFSYPQVAANGGCYFAMVDRLSWWEGLENWGDDVQGAYEMLAKNPNIDTNRIFLFATSAEASYLSQFVTRETEQWRGVILFNPSGTPNLADGHLKKMFIVGGKDDPGAADWLTKYQDEAARAGIPVKLVIQDGVQHITKSIATERERTRQFARFIQLD